MHAPSRISVLALLSLSLAAASARPVTEEEAGRAASEWLRRNPRPAGTGLVSGSVPAARAVGDEGGNPLFHVVSFGKAGSLVMSADTSVAPVVAFLDAGDVDESPGNPLFEILAVDMAARASCASDGAVRGGLRERAGRVERPGGRSRRREPCGPGRSRMGIALFGGNRRFHRRRRNRFRFRRGAKIRRKDRRRCPRRTASFVPLGTV